ncbi:GAF domain-containing protein [Argonema galeatum]|uniref:GAF domain-containing protein n=1 Tax=Argonema galeatum TaxID=2942762 RepID=UPI0020120F00|nr:GAF domain-containing protein [Argonema galeatum]MCL1463962.1 GAF domain-containing protein [Argonema galeatum A003/A1]
MTDQTLPTVLEKILSDSSTPDAVFSALLPALGEVLKCDRIFLYLYNPQKQLGKVAYCWRRSPEYPDVTEFNWKKEPASLPLEDPLFAAALRTEPSVFVEDVETASPKVVNKDFEQKNFGHRALVHAHLCQDGLLWGILQPCVFGQPRVWTEFDRFVIATITEKIAPLAVTYIKTTHF